MKMMSLTKRLSWLSGLLIVICGLFITTSMALGVGTRNSSDIFVATARTTEERWIYLLDPDRVIRLRILPHLESYTINYLQVYWYDPKDIYIRTLELVEDTTTRINVLYRHDLRTGQTSRLIDRPADLYVGMPLDVPTSASPDGRYTVFVDYSRGDLYVLDTQSGEAHHVINVSAYGLPSANSPTTQSSYPPFWGPDGRSLAYPWGDTLFIWTPDSEQPRTFEFPDLAIGYSIWAEDGQTILVRSGGGTGNAGAFAARLNLETDTLEMVVKDVATAWWMCDGQFLGYNTVRDPKTEDSTTFVNHLIDMRTRETLHLDDFPQFNTVDSRSMGVHNCDQPEWVSIVAQPDNVPFDPNQPATVTTLYTFYLLNTQTGEVVTMADAAYGMYWEPNLKRYVYFGPGEQNTQLVYTFDPATDAQSVKIGQFVNPHLNILPPPSRDFRYMIGLKSAATSGAEGRLLRIDLQTGEETYLTPDGVLVAYPYRWDP